MKVYLTPSSEGGVCTSLGSFYACWTAEEIDRYLAGRKRVAAKTFILDKKVAEYDRLYVASLLTRTGVFSGRSLLTIEERLAWAINLLEEYNWDFMEVGKGEHYDYEN